MTVWYGAKRQLRKERQGTGAWARGSHRSDWERAVTWSEHPDGLSKKVMERNCRPASRGIFSKVSKRQIVKEEPGAVVLEVEARDLLFSVFFTPAVCQKL